MSLSPWPLRLGRQLLGTVLAGEPVAKGRPRVNTKTGTIYTPSVTRKAEKAVNDHMRKVGPPRPYEDDLAVWLTFHCSPRRPGDADNYVKLAGARHWWTVVEVLPVETNLFPNPWRALLRPLGAHPGEDQLPPSVWRYRRDDEG